MKPLHALICIILYGLPYLNCFAKQNQHLFTIERSTNKNFINYDINLNEKNEINLSDPVHAYWVMAQTDSHLEELTYFENTHAYGFTIKLISQNNYLLVTKAIRDRAIYISKVNNMFSAVTDINGQMSYLKKIYVQVKDGFIPKVEYILITGTDINTHKEVSEQILSK